MSTNDQKNTQQSTTPPNKSKVVQVQGNTIPGQSPPPPAQQQPAAVGAGGVAKAAPNNNQQDPNNIDIEKFIADNTAEVKTMDEKETERKKKMDYLTKAIDSRFKFERLVFNDSETGEYIGTKMQYVKDGDGKTIYDYINDPVVTEHIQFVVPEEDPQDGSPVNKQITFFWTKPTF